MRKSTLDELVLGMVEDLWKTCNYYLWSVLDLVEELDFGQDLTEKDLVLLVWEETVGMDDCEA